MSRFNYNGVELSLIKTQSIDRVPVYSPDNTEYMYTEFTINIVAAYSPSFLATSYSSSGPASGNLPEITDHAIRHYLMQPRRCLFFEANNNPIINLPCDLFGDALDSRNGPLPQSCSVRRIAGVSLWYVEYSIKTWVIECPAATFLSPIASSRYSRTEEINDEYLSTMTTTGIAYFRSDILEALQKTADSYRGYLVPPTLFGFQRTNLVFSLSSDGLSLTWSTTDVERKQDLGNPSVPGTAGSLLITKMDLIYSVMPQSLGAQVRMAGWSSIVNIEVSATGTKYSSNLDMLKFCMRCAINRLGTSFTKGIMQDAMVTDDFFNHFVKFSTTYLVLTTGVVGNKGFLDFPIPLDGFVGAPIVSLPSGQGINPIPFFENATRGTSAYQLAVNAFAVACYSEPGPVIDPTGEVIPPLVGFSSPQQGTSPQVSAYLPPDLPPATSLRKDQPSRSLSDKPTAIKTREESTSVNKRHTGIIPLPKAFKTPSQLGPPTGGGSLGDATPTPTPTPTPSPSDINVVMIQIHQPYTEREQRWRIGQLNSPPYLPNPTSPAGEDDKFLRLTESTIAPGVISLGPDGYTLVYNVEGSYKYVITNDVGPKPPLSYNIPSNIDADQIPIEFASIDSDLDYDSTQEQINNDFQEQSEMT